MKYEEYIQSKEWRAKKRERLVKDNFLCQDCRIPNKALEVHHITYDRLGDEDIFDLVTLCRKCHIDIHQRNGDDSVVKKMMAQDTESIEAEYIKERELTTDELIEALL